jgi:hypothetical protein
MALAQFEVTNRSTGYADVLKEQFEGPYIPAAFIQQSITLGLVLPTLQLREPTTRQFSLAEQRVLQRALRASVTVVHKARRTSK